MYSTLYVRYCDISYNREYRARKIAVLRFRDGSPSTSTRAITVTVTGGYRNRNLEKLISMNACGKKNGRIACRLFAIQLTNHLT